MSQAEVANRSQVSPSYIGLIETGLRGTRPNEQAVKRFARAMQLTQSETATLLRAAGLLGENQPLRPPSITTEDVIDSDPLLSTEQKTLMRSFYGEMTRSRRRDTA